MAKATIAVAVLALALLLTGPVAASAGRALKQANAGAQSGGFSYGNNQFAQSGGFDQAATFTNPYASGGAAGGAGYSVAVGADGKPSISTAVGEGTTLSIDGKSQSQASANAQNNGIPGTGAYTNINVGSSNGGAATDAIAKAAALGK